MYLAEYDPDAHGTPLHDAVVRQAGEADLPGCAELMAEREGCAAEECRQRLAYGLEDGQPLFVAALGDAIVGFARVSWLTPAQQGGWNAPDGWYLSGVVVDKAVRRHGLGRALTRARCEWVWERHQPVHFVVNSANRASMDLHRELGFREVTRDFQLPGVTFTDGEGVLFSCDASSLAQQVTELRVGAAR